MIVRLDIMMLGAGGYEVCRSIRRDDRRTPVLFLSAKSYGVEVVPGFESGAGDFLRRPFGTQVGRDLLFNECRGLRIFPESRALDQHILNLRKKVEEDPSDPRLIETARDAGYRYPARRADFPLLPAG